MSRLDRLLTAYRNHIGAPWEIGLAGAQKVIFAVYDKTDELRLRARIEEFAIVTQEASHRWQLIDITNAFPEWMGAHRYRESYFEDPASLEGYSDGQINAFCDDLADQVRVGMLSQSDDNTVTALLGVGTLFGVARVSKLVERVASYVPGRLLVFFPGEYSNNNYRLLDARDGWDYLAIPLLATE